MRSGRRAGAETRSRPRTGAIRLPVGVLNNSRLCQIAGSAMWLTFLTCVLWHRGCTLSAGFVFLSTGGTQITYVLIVSVLLSGLFGAVATAAAAGSHTYIEVGGIPSSQQNATESNRRIDKPQTGLGSLSIPDTTRRDNPLGGAGQHGGAGGQSLVPSQKTAIDKPQTGGGGTTLPFSNSGIFPSGPATSGQPANQFCSSREVTIGENTQSRLHCSNTVGGTLRQ
jgi:hypothetical protein